MMTSAMGNASSSTRSAWSFTFDQIKKNHDAAYAAIDQGITLEEQGKPDEAIQKYKLGIQLIDEALRVQVTCPENPDLSWERACVMIQKMKKTRGEVLTRINNISTSTPTEPCEQPPSYEEAVASSTESLPRTYNELADALNQLSIDPNIEMEPDVIYVYEGVKLYFISPNNEVSSTLRPQTLKIILLENEGENLPRAVMHIGDWVYPLVPGVSPCYRTDYGAFILPNVYSEIPGSSIGIILPSDADADAYKVLEDILYGIVSPDKPLAKEAPPELSQKISNGIVTGASFISKGLIFGAEKVGGLINQGTPKLINRMNSADQPTEIPPRVSRGMQMAETATYKATKVTGYVAEQVGIATMKLGHFLAPHIEKQGTRLLTTGFHMSEKEASSKMKGALTVAAGAVEGFSTVYRGLENSAAILATSLKNNTIKVVHHKYGPPAGEFADDTLNTVENVIHISQHARIINPKYLVKRTVKDAGKAVVYRGAAAAGPSTSRCNDVLRDEKDHDSSKTDLPEKK